MVNDLCDINEGYPKEIFIFVVPDHPTSNIWS